MGLKEFLRHQTHLPQEALHIYAGVFLYLAIVLVLRTSRRRWIALAIVWAAALLNEISDFEAIRLGDDPYSWTEAVTDIAHTILIPVILTILPAQSIREKAADPSPDSTEPDDPL